MNTNVNTVVYALAGARDCYRVLSYFVIYEAPFGVTTEVHRIMERMLMRYPDIRSIYMMDNRRGMPRDYKEAYNKNSIESWSIFKDMLDREGFKIYDRTKPS